MASRRQRVGPGSVRRRAPAPSYLSPNCVVQWLTRLLPLGEPARYAGATACSVPPTGAWSGNSFTSRPFDRSSSTRLLLAQQNAGASPRGITPQHSIVHLQPSEDCHLGLAIRPLEGPVSRGRIGPGDTVMATELARQGRL